MYEIYFETYGCTANQNSTEIMKGLVKQAGMNLTQNPEYSDMIIINSCIVKQPTINKIKRKVQDYLKQFPNKKIILTGCMPRLFQKQLQYLNLFLLDISQIKNLPELIREIQENNYNLETFLKQRNEVKADLPKISDSKIIGITQVSEGCLGECTYCITRLAKGKLFSYPEEKILESIKKDIEAGGKEILITSQDCAAYGLDENKKSQLPKLLREILKLKGNFQVRLGMLNPNHLLSILEEIIEIYKNKKMFKFLHLPIQSGSDKILKDMKRNYNVADVEKIISEFKKCFPEITISTDIIVGYPTETEKDFQQTLSLINKIKPEILNRSNFSSHKLTPASRLNQIPETIITKRATQLMKLHLDICKEIQKPYLNKELKVLIDKKGFQNTWLGRTENYKLVAVHSIKKILGKKVNVKIKKIMPHYLLGEITDEA